MYSVLAIVLATLIGVAFIVVVVRLYLLPAIIAYDRWHPQRQAILALNLLLGCSFLGWAAAMIWAWTNSQPSPTDLTA